MSLEIQGKLLVKYDIQQVSEKFKKQEFVIELAEEINGNIYTNFAKMQLVQNKCDILNRFKEGDTVKVSFNIKGNKWERDGKVTYVTNLDAWRIESVGNNQQTAPAQPKNEGIPVYSADHTTNGGSGYPSAPGFTPNPETIDDSLPF